MEQLIAIIFIALLIYFIVKVGRVLWRVLGVVFLLFLIYLYKDQAMAQINQFIANPNFEGLFQSISQFFNHIWQLVTATIE